MNKQYRRWPGVIAAFLILALLHKASYPTLGVIKGYHYLRKMTSKLVEGNTTSPPWWEGGDGCSCEGTPQIDTPRMGDDVGGTCGARAWAAGESQSVIAFSLYGNNPTYYKGLDQILKRCVEYYPDYYVRIYTDPTNQIKPIICPLICQFPKLHVCNVRGLPAPLGDLTKRANNDPHMWRFLPLGDSQVDVSLSRDTDSKITPREVAAVNEWLASGVALHVMRDYQAHIDCILAGMWGVRTDHSSLTSVNTHKNLVKLMNQLLNVSKNVEGNDQMALKNVVWPALKDSSMRHESFRCEEYPNSRPYPTQRQYMDFIGAKWLFAVDSGMKTNEQCKYNCRPVDHKDWLFC